MLESQLQMCTDQAKEHTYVGHHNNLHGSGSLASVKPNLATRKKKSHTISDRFCKLPFNAPLRKIALSTAVSSPTCAMLGASWGKYLFSWVSQADFTQPQPASLNISSETQHFPQHDSKVHIQPLHLNSAHSCCCLQTS